ncbi:MAG: hypothetical protein H0U10_05395 [Chloroflexia bacterium]|nr:hypothetical protein [Chloroflexia bacterium]
MNKRAVALVVGVVLLALFIDRLGETPAAIVVSVLGTASVWALERRKEVEAAQRQRKADAYHDFTDLLFVGILAPIAAARTKGEQFKPSPEVEAKIAALSAKVVLAANLNVLKRYCNFLDETMTRDATAPSREMFDDLADLIRLFRQEMGYSDGKLSNADLYPLFGAPRNHILRLPETAAKKADAGVGPAVAVATLPPSTGPEDAPPRSTRPKHRSRVLKAAASDSDTPRPGTQGVPRR